jgi:crotonobetainyl-CoA:carnitine CoA-transferase CaiB-like acyl-CoA transferase
VVAAPLTTRYLAAFGAEVIKIENKRHPDNLRVAPFPRPAGNHSPNVSGIFNNFNVNKRSLAIDMTSAGGQAIIRQLIAVSDVVVDNFGVDPFPRWGLTYPEVAAIRPDIIMLRASVNGRTGAGSNYIGFGFTIGPASGINTLMGFPEDPPFGTSTAHPDYSSNPHHAAIALLAALHYRNRTGKGQYIDLSQMESTVAFLSPAMVDYAVNRTIHERIGNRSPWTAPHGAYQCAGDDRWLALDVTNEDEWATFAGVVGESWTSDPRFATMEARLDAVDDLDARISEWTKDRDAVQLMHALQAAGVSAAVVQSHEDLLLHDEHIAERGYFVKLEHPEAGVRVNDGIAINLSETPGSIRTPSPLIGEHNDEVLGEILGYDEDAINMLYVDGILE